MTPTAQFTKISRLVPPVSTSPSLALSILCLVTTLAGGCSADPRQDSPDQGTTNPSCPSSRLESAPAAAEPTYLPTPSSLRAAYLRGRQDERASDHAFVPVSGALPALSAQNLEQGLEVILDRAGLHLSSTRGGNGTGVSVRLTDQGCAAAPRAADLLSPQVVQPHRAEYARPDITEWYLNGPLGLEHGFTVHRDLGCSDGRLVFTMTLAGAIEAALASQGESIRLVVRNLRESSTGSLLVYGGLFAVDADGKELPSRLTLSGRTVRLEVDAADARYPVIVDPMWTEQARLTGSDGGFDDEYSWSVAISGNTALVGAPNKKIGSNAVQGQAYVYVRTGTSWSEQSKLVASDGAFNDQFGYGVAIDGDTAVISARMKTLGANTYQGQAYIFVRKGTSWYEQAKLVASDGADRDLFGNSVAISGDTAVIAASSKWIGSAISQGQVYVYARTGTAWSEQAKLVARDGDGDDLFGSSVSISGDTLVIGASGKSVGASGQGVTYVYVRSGSVWSQQAQLIASDGAEDDAFGYAVSVSGDTAVVGAYFKNLRPNNAQGQAYVFLRSGTSWAEQAKLTASDGADTDNFGAAVAVTGDIVLVGARIKDVAANASQGRAYVYLRTGATWSEHAILTGADGASHDLFGYTVAVNGDTALIGAPTKSLGARLRQGQAYTFLLPTASPASNGAPCLKGTDCRSSFCVENVCCDASCGGSTPTDCQSCIGLLTGGQDGTCGLISQGSRYTCRPAAHTCDKAEVCDGSSHACPPDVL